LFDEIYDLFYVFKIGFDFKKILKSSAKTDLD